MCEYQNNKCCEKREENKGEMFEAERVNENRYEDKREEFREEKLKNRASIQVETCGKKHKIESNELEARKINLIIREEQNCGCVFAGDEIEYKVRIFNDSHVEVRNIEFDDIFSDCGRYKKDSFKVNGRKEHPHVDDRHIRYRIDEIKPHQEVVICFEIYFK